MLTDDQYQAWLIESASSTRCLLVALESDVDIICCGWPAYISRPDDNYANLGWDDVLSELPEFASSSGVQEVGDLEIIWPNQINELLSRHWRGRQYRMWLGAVDWSMNDFRVISSGRISSVERTAPHRLRFNFLSAAVVLDAPIVATTEDSTLELELSVAEVNNPRDFDIANTSIPLPHRYLDKLADDSFDLPLGNDALSPPL